MQSIYSAFQGIRSLSVTLYSWLPHQSALDEQKAILLPQNNYGHWIKKKHRNQPID
jgi:hypothetical protein